MTAPTISSSAGPSQAHRSTGTQWRRVAREIALLGGLYLFYRSARVVAAHHVKRAFGDAEDLLTFEQRLHLPRELGLQHLLLAHHDLAKAANAYYAGVHFPITIGVMVWCWVRRADLYSTLRNSLVLMTTAGLVLHLAIPVAPPRLLPQLGFVDVGALIGPSVYGPPGSDHLADQYAALPSLHVGWAVLIAAVMIKATHSRWRWLWVLHPVLTTLVVVSTGNHYWLDGLAAVALLLLAVGILHGLAFLSRRHRLGGVGAAPQGVAT